MNHDLNGDQLRYCSPFHGGWDIARMALRLPESHIIFFCPASCARIIALNALKNGVKERISVYGLTESEIVLSDYEDAALSSVRAVLSQLKKRPRVIILFVSCIDSMLATDHEGELSALRALYPDIRFTLMRMNPICQSTQAQLPLFKLQEDIFDHLDAPGGREEKLVAVIGSNVPLRPQSELRAHLHRHGFALTHDGECDSFEEFQRMARARLNLVAMPYGIDAVKSLKARLGIDFYPLPQTLFPDAIDLALKEICARLSIPAPDLASLREEALSRLEAARRALGGLPLVLDGSAFMQPLNAARFFLERGFSVCAVYANASGFGEQEAAEAIRREHPEVSLIDSGHFFMPGRRSAGENELLAIGLEGGCFSGARYTAPLFMDDGRWGYDGLCALSERMESALSAPRTARQISQEERPCGE